MDPCRLIERLAGLDVHLLTNCCGFFSTIVPVICMNMEAFHQPLKFYFFVVNKVENHDLQLVLSSDTE